MSKVKYYVIVDGENIGAYQNTEEDAMEMIDLYVGKKEELRDRYSIVRIEE